MGIFDKFAKLPERHARILSVGQDPIGVTIDEILSATEASIGGRRILLAGTNNYLGLTFDPDCVEAAATAIRAQGTGTTGSRIANGTYLGHSDLEARLAAFLGYDQAIVFSTGYQANLGTIAGLASADDYVLIDADCHASIYDACKLSGATVIRFRHNSPADLERRMQRLDPDANKLVCIEGLYSMLGDTAPVAEFAEVKRAGGAYLFVDEAHSVGVFGERGRGVAEREGVGDDVDFVVGTFSKSLGSIGGFAASNHPEFKYLRFASRPYMFTASPAPANVASVIAAIEQIERRPEIRMHLWRNTHALHDGLSALGFELGAAASPVIAIKMPSEELAVVFWNQLMEAGVYVNLAIPPGTPNSLSLLRCSVSAAHSLEQIQQICDAFDMVGHRLGVIGEPAVTAAAAG